MVNQFLSNRAREPQADQPNNSETNISAKKSIIPAPRPPPTSAVLRRKVPLVPHLPLSRVRRGVARPRVRPLRAAAAREVCLDLLAGLAAPGEAAVRAGG